MNNTPPKNERAFQIKGDEKDMINACDPIREIGQRKKNSIFSPFLRNLFIVNETKMNIFYNKRYNFTRKMDIMNHQTLITKKKDMKNSILKSKFQGN